MRVAGIVVEYNPLHYGHLHHLNETKKLSGADLVIAVMSSHVVQRGEFSIADKFTKTKWALKAGVDLVIELPGVFSLQSADLFARTSVDILHRLGVTDLYFGSETGDIKPLEFLVELMNTDQYHDQLKHHMNQGKSYPTSSDLALKSLTDSEIFALPNNILGLQYLRAIKDLKSPMKAHTIKRLAAGYYDDIVDDSAIQSATSIRRLHGNQAPINAFVPPYVHRDLSTIDPFDDTRLFPYMMYTLKTSTAETLRNLFGFEEGLENLFLKHHDAGSYSELLERLSSARYTNAKIKRTLMHMVIGIKKDVLTTFEIPYIRVLGMNKTGQQYLNRIKKDYPIPLITKIKADKHPYLDYELRITRLFDLVHQTNYFKQEFKPVIIV